jgi:hypothetical protein
MPVAFAKPTLTRSKEKPAAIHCLISFDNFYMLSRKEEESSSMQLKRVTSAAAKSSSAGYEVFVSCNKCGGIHEMGISVVIENGPITKQSVGALYDGKPLPKILSDLSNNNISCPQTGRQSTQKNYHQIFLVPPKR